MPEIVGASSTGFTRRLKEEVVIAPPESCAVKVITVVPFWLSCGVIVTVREEPLPPTTIEAFGTRTGFDELALTVKPQSPSTSSTVKASGPSGTSSSVPWSANTEMVGGSLIGLTVTWKVRLKTPLVAEQSLTVTVITEVPLAFVTELKVSVAVASGLLYATTGAGINPGLLELAVTLKDWFSL